MGLKQRVIAQFRRPSGRIGAHAGWIMAHRPSNRRRNAWALELLALPPGGRLLEIGHGPGLALEQALAENVGFALGLDHSPVMQAQTARRCAGALTENRLELRAGGLETLRPEDRPFNGAMMANVAQFLPDRHNLFAQICKALAPGGRFVIVHQPRTERDKHAAADAMEAVLTTELQVSGFTSVASRRFAGVDTPVIGIVALAP